MAATGKEQWKNKHTAVVEGDITWSSDTWNGLLWFNWLFLDLV